MRDLGRPLRARTPPTEEAGGLTRHHRVAAVVVARDGEVWLPAVLTVLGAQTRPPERIVGVDAGSQDSSAAILDEALGGDRVARLPRDPAPGFGTAVAAGLAAAEPMADHPEIVEWIWLLHDDCAPAPDCLERLLEEADVHPRAVVLGPKALGWHDRRLLLEMGFTVTGSGQRVTDLEPREHDQGQHDGRSAVHAVGTAGMLVRRDVWDEFGGLDPALPLYRDDLDLCWRAWRAGHEVRIAPAAVVHHREASYHGRRVGSTRPGRGHRLDRRSALHVLLAQAPAWQLPLLALWLLLGSGLRALGYLIGKDLRRAADEVLAWGALLAHPGRLAASRRSIRSTSTLSSRAAVGEFRPGVGSRLRHGLEAVGGALTAGRSTAPTPSGALESGPTSDDLDLYDDYTGGWLRRVITRPGVAAIVALVVLALVATRTLWFGDGVLLGGALLPAPPGAGDLWATYTATFHDVGPGSDTAAPPALALLAGLAWLLLGKAPVAVTVLLLLSVPAAGLSAWWSLRGILVGSGVRVWAVLAYALLPAIVGGLAGGRLGMAAAAILLPPTARTTARALGARLPGLAAPTARTAWWAAVLIAALLACLPALAPLVAVGVIAAIVDLVRRHRRGEAADPVRPVLEGGRIAIVALVPLILLLPWSLRLVTDPGTLLAEPGLPGPVDASVSPLAIALLHPGGPGMSTLLAGVGIVVAGALALLRPEVRRSVVGLWAMAIVALVWGIVVTLVRVTPSGANDSQPGWPGAATLVMGAALILAGALGADGLRERMARATFSWRQPVATVGALIAITAPLIAAIWWIPGAGDPLRRGDPQILPPFVAAEAQGPQAPRTLVLRGVPTGVDYSLVNGAGPVLGDADTAPDAAVWAPLDALVGDLVSGRGGDEVSGLADYAVRYVVAIGEADADLVATLDSAPGLRRVAGADSEVLWRVQGITSRVRLVGDDGAVTQLPVTDAEDADPLLSGSVGGPGTVRLAIPAGLPWRASTAAGQDLEPVEEPTGLQAFVLPADTAPGTSVLIEVDGTTRGRWLIAQGALLVIVVVLALPARRRAQDGDTADDSPDPDKSSDPGEVSDVDADATERAG